MKFGFLISHLEKWGSTQTAFYMDEKPKQDEL